jgi:hypothetical protein
MQSCQKFRVRSNKTFSDRDSISFPPPPPPPALGITSYDPVIKEIHMRMSFECLFKLTIGTGAIFKLALSERAFCYKGLTTSRSNAFQKVLSVTKGYNRRIARRKVFLTEERQKTRLAWTLDYLQWGVPDWNKVIFSDECAFNIGGRYGKTHVTRRPGEAYVESCIEPKFQRIETVMVWGCIMGDQKGPLIIWDKLRPKDVGNIILRVPYN